MCWDGEANIKWCKRFSVGAERVPCHPGPNSLALVLMLRQSACHATLARYGVFAYCLLTCAQAERRRSRAAQVPQHEQVLFQSRRAVLAGAQEHAQALRIAVLRLEEGIQAANAQVAQLADSSLADSPIDGRS